MSRDFFYIKSQISTHNSHNSPETLHWWSNCTIISQQNISSLFFLHLTVLDNCDIYLVKGFVSCVCASIRCCGSCSGFKGKRVIKELDTHRRYWYRIYVLLTLYFLRPIDKTDILRPLKFWMFEIRPWHTCAPVFWSFQ